MADRRPILRPVDFDPFGACPRQHLWPLTEPQAEMWTAAAMGAEANCAYNQCFAFTLDGPLCVESLGAALGQLVARHKALRVVIPEDGSGQTLLPPFEVQLTLEDLSAVDLAYQESRVAAILERESTTPFDLAKGPLVRALVVRESADRNQFVLTVHHIVCDGWSSTVLFSDLGRLYTADRVGIPAQLPNAASYRDFLTSQARPEERAIAASDEDYWAEQYATGAPILELPLVRPRPAAKTYRSAREELRLDADLYAALKRTAAESGATLFAALLAAYEVLLYRLSGQSDFVVGIPYAGQPELDNPALVAHCVNTLPLRARLDPAAPFAEHLRTVRDELANAWDHSHLTFGGLVRRLNIPRDRSRTPLVSTTFTIDKVGAPFDFGDVTIASLTTPRSYANFELAVNILDSGSDLVVECDYNADLFDGPTLRAWISHYGTLLRAIVARPDSALQALPILNDEDKRTILEAWNNTQTNFPDEKRLHRLFEAQVRRTPDSEALIDGTERLSYADLNSHANRLAYRLRRANVGPGITVGVCQKRHWNLIVTLLAIMKAGGAYVPLDPQYPKDRLAFMLEDSGARVLVTQADLAASFDGFVLERIVVDDPAESLESESAGDLDMGASNNDLAYVIYTSGSTGVPKGVAIEHRSAGTLIYWARTVFSDHELSGFLASTSVCFDLSVFEIFVPLAFGGRVILADHALEIASIPARDEVVLVNTVPSAATEIVRAHAMPESVETVCLAGEFLSTRLVDQVYSAGHVERVIDLYGPSEDTTYSTFTVREPRAPATIGRPISNTQAYVVDARREPVPIGVVGELYLAGDGLARGYLNRDTITAERFIVSSFGGRSTKRAYRTGDLARYRADGSLEFLGRTDNLVKIRGFRIELGEIEATLAASEEVKDVVVIAREDRPGDKRLVAYIVVRSDTAGIVDRLRYRLRERLPVYMVPAHFVVLKALPLTPNGKVDRKSLQAPDFDALPQHVRQVAPSTPTERRIAAIWGEALGIASPGIKDDFFEVGGHSLMAAQVVTAVRSEFGVEMGMRHLFSSRRSRAWPASSTSSQCRRPADEAPQRLTVR